MRNVILAILAEISPVSVNDGRGVVVNAGDLFFVDRHDNHHVVLLCRLLHYPGRRAFRNLLDRVVPAHLLLGTEVWRREDFLHAENLHALFGRIFDQRQMFFEILLLDLFYRRISWRRISCLNQSASNCSWHGYSEVSGRRFQVSS